MWTKDALLRQIQQTEANLRATPEYLSASRAIGGSAMNYLATHPVQLQRFMQGGRVPNPRHRLLTDDLQRFQYQLKRIEYAESHRPAGPPETR